MGENQVVPKAESDLVPADSLSKGTWILLGDEVGIIAGQHSILLIPSGNFKTNRNYNVKVLPPGYKLTFVVPTLEQIEI
jgi:hypothetical protein